MANILGAGGQPIGGQEEKPIPLEKPKQSGVRNAVVKYSYKVLDFVRFQSY
jgi:hypothetical protein